MFFHNSHIRMGLVLCLCLGLVGGLVRCGERSPEPSPIRIGMLVDLTGVSGELSLKAAMMAVEALNDAGGLDLGGHKHQVVLLVEDIENFPEEASRAALKLINQENVIALVSAAGSVNAIPAAMVAESARIPMISPGSTHPGTTAGKDYVFRASFVDPFQGRVLARFALEELRISTAAVLYDVANTYSRGIAMVIKEEFEAAGGQMVAFESYTTGDQDWSDQLARIRNRRPEALFLPNLSSGIVTQARQARQLDIDAVFLGSDGWIPEELARYPELEGSFLTQHWHLDAVDTIPEGRSFVAAFRQAYDRTPTSSAALTYDAVGLLFQSIRSAGRADPERIREALSRVENYRGVTGTITYRGAGGDPQKQVLIIRMNDGKAGVYKKIKP